MRVGRRLSGSRPARWLLLAAVAACATGQGPAPVEVPEEAPLAERFPLPTRQPFVRVGLGVGADSVRLGAPGGLRLEDPASGKVLRRVPGEEEVVRAAPDGLRIAGEVSGRPHALLLVEPEEPGAQVLVDGRPYRGTLELFRVEPHGMVVVNQLGLEDYLLGVVPLEIGPRTAHELEAVKAQAVAARTYTIRNFGRRDSLGFDVFGGVLDQVYGGRKAERETITAAVSATVGEVLTWRGAPIRAYYHSTGGGWTARVSDVWELPDAPYLRRVPDARPGGGDYCDISPRYAWEASWSHRELDSAVARGVERRFGAARATGTVTGVRVTGRMAHGRIAGLEVQTEGGRWRVEKDDVRFFLHTPDGRPLPSSRFEVVAGPPADSGLTLRGRGYGHGVGMCQWGAIGRARAGQSYEEILAHYYPGTELRGAYSPGPDRGSEPPSGR